MAGEETAADVLVLSSGIGSGHMRASAALVRGAELVDPEKVFSVLDFPHEVSPRIEHLLRSAYLESLKLWPAAYGRVYRSSEGSGRHGSSYRHFVEDAGLRALDRLRSGYGARTLVAPHFYGADVLGRYKEQNPDVFAAVVLTDYLPHPVGVPPNADLYVVADEAAAEMVVGLGVPEEKVHPTGIPIDPAFDEEADVGGVRRDLLNIEDDDLPIVLVMGGGLGGGDLDKTVSSLSEASAAMHLVVLCGSNDRTRKRLERKAEQDGCPTTFLAFTDRVRELMAAASVLVSKPGGMSCTEALASGLPQVLYHPIPGQEEDNAAAMARYGAGVVVGGAGEVLGETLRILVSPDHRRRMVEGARAAHRPHAAKKAADLVLGGLP